MRTQKTLPPSGILVAVASCMALQMTGFVLILPLFARHFESLGAGVEALSMSAMAYALTGAFAAPLTGMLADRFGRRPIILLSLTAYVLAFSGYLFAASAWLLIVLRGLTGVFTAGLLPAMASVVGDLAPEKRRGRWIGIVSGGASAGWIAGPLLGGLLYDRFGHVAPFAASIALAAGALLLAVLLIPETHRPAAHPTHLRLAWAQAWQTLPGRPTYLLLLFVIFGSMFAWAFIEPQFMFYVYDDLKWSSSQLGLVMSAYGVAFMAGEFALGQASDRLGRKPVLALGLALFSAQFVGLAVFRDAPWIMASFIVAGLGNALYDPALSALILDMTPPEKTASMMGLRGMAGSLGSMLGPGLVVLLTPVLSARAGFLMATVIVASLVLVIGLGLRLPQGVEVARESRQTALEQLGAEHHR